MERDAKVVRVRKECGARGERSASALGDRSVRSLRLTDRVGLLITASRGVGSSHRLVHKLGRVVAEDLRPIKREVLRDRLEQRSGEAGAGLIGRSGGVARHGGVASHRLIGGGDGRSEGRGGE